MKPSKKCYGEKRTQGYDNISLGFYFSGFRRFDAFASATVKFSRRSRLLSFSSLRNYFI